MNSIDLLRTLNDEELIAFIKMMSGDTEKLELWVENVRRAKKFIRDGKIKDYICCSRVNFKIWCDNLLNEASEMEKQIYNGDLEL